MSKKIVSLMLALVMVLSIGCNAFAATKTRSNGRVTFDYDASKVVILDSSYDDIGDIIFYAGTDPRNNLVIEATATNVFNGRTYSVDVEPTGRPGFYTIETPDFWFFYLNYYIKVTVNEPEPDPEPHVCNIVYTTGTNTITAFCSSTDERCPISNTNFTLVLNVENAMEGEFNGATVSDTDWDTAVAGSYAVTYIKKGETEGTDNPTSLKADDYVARLTVANDVYIEKEFTINPKPAPVHYPTLTLNKGDNPAEFKVYKLTSLVPFRTQLVQPTEENGNIFNVDPYGTYYIDYTLPEGKEFVNYRLPELVDTVIMGRTSRTVNVPQVKDKFVPYVPQWRLLVLTNAVDVDGRANYTVKQSGTDLYGYEYETSKIFWYDQNKGDVTVNFIVPDGYKFVDQNVKNPVPVDSSLFRNDVDVPEIEKIVVPEKNVVVIEIGKTAEDNGEKNPDTGAPSMSLAAVAVVLGAAFVVSKKH